MKRFTTIMVMASSLPLRTPIQNINYTKRCLVVIWDCGFLIGGFVKLVGVMKLVSWRGYLEGLFTVRANDFWFNFIGNVKPTTILTFPDNPFLVVKHNFHRVFETSSFTTDTQHLTLHRLYYSIGG